MNMITVTLVGKATIINLMPCQVDVLIQSGDCTENMELALTLPACDDLLLPYFVTNSRREFNRNSMETEEYQSRELRYPFYAEMALTNPQVTHIILEDSVRSYLEGTESQSTGEAEKPIWFPKVCPIVRSVVVNKEGTKASLGRRYLIVQKEDL